MEEVVGLDILTSDGQFGLALVKWTTTSWIVPVTFWIGLPGEVWGFFVSAMI